MSQPTDEVALIDQAISVRHAATMQRALEAFRFTLGVSQTSHLTTLEPR
jgi:hypothetical protein